MPSCPRCLALTPDDLAYCTVCGRSRIVESLRAPKTPPAWLRPLQLTVLSLLCVWLLVTLGVAFLREARAVREARKLLAEQQPQKAWEWLEPFLKDNPRHAQGLLLGGEAAIQIGRMADAKQCLTTLIAVDAKLGAQLGAEDRALLAQQARTIGCDTGAYARLLESSAELGEPYLAGVIDSVDAVVEACYRQRQDWWGIQQVSGLLSQYGQPHDLLHKGYAPAIGRELAQGHYATARSMAMRALQLDRDGYDEVAKILGAERERVAATSRTLGELCRKLESDPRYRTGGGWCFPAAPPMEVQAAKDAWGKSFRYVAFAPAAGQTCYTGAAVVSYGAAARLVRGDRQSPAGGIVCRVSAGAESWNHPDRFWEPEETGH
jgi:tetratricopeptide (TPR) repeat protein